METLFSFELSANQTICNLWGNKVRTNFNAKLAPGERLLWEGRAGAGVMFGARDIFLVPFSLVWLGFVIFWLFGVTSAGAPLPFLAFGMIFLCVGLVISVGRFILDAWLRENTTYAVTDKRVLINRDGPMSSFTSLELDRLPDVSLVSVRSGRGSIRFGPTMSFFSNPGMSIWVPALDASPQFLAIDDAQSVFDTVMRASRDVRTSRG